MRQKPVQVTEAHRKALKKLLSFFNNQTDIALSLGITRQAVNHWFVGEKVIPLGQAGRLAAMLGNKITIQELRPDFEKRLKKDLHLIK